VLSYFQNLSFVSDTETVPDEDMPPAIADPFQENDDDEEEEPFQKYRSTTPKTAAEPGNVRSTEQSTGEETAMTKEVSVKGDVSR